MSIRVNALAPIPVLGCALLWSAPVDAAQLIVNVENGLTGTPVPGAFVMVGSGEGTPFPGNTGVTDASGSITFDDAALVGLQTATAGITGFGYTTLYQSAVDEVTLRLYPTITDEDMGGDRTQVEGEVDNVETVSNDGNLDVSIILNAVSPETVMFFDYLPFIFGIEAVEFPVVGTVDLPENIFITPQTEFLFFVFEKSPYRLGVPGNRPVSFVSVTARAPISELSEDPDLSSFEIREIGVERDIDVVAPGIFNLDINSDIDTNPTGLTINFVGVPAGSATRIISGSTTGSGTSEELFGYSTLDGLIDETSTYDTATFNPTGDLADATNVAMARYSDPSAAETYAVGIFDRSGFSVPATIDFDSWFAQPVLSQEGLSFHWEDPTVDGVSPTPTWTQSVLGLRPVDPSDGSVDVTVDWRIWAPAGAGAIELPSLPPSAPGPAGGLSDPAATPGADQLAWSWTAVNSSGDIADLIGGNFLAGGTHWTQGWIPITFDPASTPETEITASTIELSTFPSPSRNHVEFRWSRALEGDAVLEVLSATGRRIASLPVASGATSSVWSGRDVNGRDAAGGIYWARLLSEGKVRGRARIVRLQ